MVMDRVNSYLHQQHLELSALPLDEALFAKILEDLQRNAKEHKPADVWLAAGGGGDDKKASDFSAKNLLQPWLGFGSTRVAEDSLFWYHQYLRNIDSLGLVDTYFETDGRLKPAGAELLVADLGSIVDVNLASAFVQSSPCKPVQALEVGGGYGRLAEAFFNVFPGQVKWVLVDAVPSSLVYAYEYLTRSNPEIEVGFSYRDDPFDMKRFDCYIAPTWRLDVIPKNFFDLAVNVQSMQEMDQRHVDYYLNWFDGALKQGGIAYLNNRRDHVFRGEWHYPAHWECLLKTCTPRSWKRDFPAEVFRKGNRSFAAENQVRDAFYRRELAGAAQSQAAAGEARGYKLY
jgi:SAM-dependent methyltransferase